MTTVIVLQELLCSSHADRGQKGVSELPQQGLFLLALSCKLTQDT